MISELRLHLYGGRIVKNYYFERSIEEVKDAFLDEINACIARGDASFILETEEEFAAIYPAFISFWEVVIVSDTV